MNALAQVLVTKISCYEDNRMTTLESIMPDKVVQHMSFYRNMVWMDALDEKGG